MNLLDNYLASRRTEEENHRIDKYIDPPPVTVTNNDKEEIKGRGRKGKPWTKRR
jgi:hypothetical protein